MSHKCTFLWAEIKEKYNVVQQPSRKRVAQYSTAYDFSYLWFLNFVSLHMAKNLWLPHQAFVCLLEQDVTDVTNLFTLSILALGSKFCYLLSKRLQCSTFSSSDTG